MTDADARAHVWTLCLSALVLCALTDPVVGLLTALAHASAPALPILLAAVLATVLVGAHVARAVLRVVAVLLAVAVPRVVRPCLDSRR